MEKIKIVSINKSDFRSEYVFRKEQIFFEFVRKFLVDLGIDETVFVDFIGRPCGDDGDPDLQNEENIKNYIDRIDSLSNEEYSVDLIYFSQKIHMIINSREDKQQEIVQVLEKYVDFGED